MSFQDKVSNYQRHATEQSISMRDSERGNSFIKRTIDTSQLGKVA